MAFRKTEAFKDSTAPSKEVGTYQGKRWEYRARNLKKVPGMAYENDFNEHGELGGSNVIANLFPEPGSGKANYRFKDAAENRAKAWVCEGRLSLGVARRGFASNWLTLYRRLFGHAPNG